MSDSSSPVHAHPALHRQAVELEHAIRDAAADRDARWDAFEHAVLEHLADEELELLPRHAAAHREDVEALLVEHHDIRLALVRGRHALATADAREAQLAIAAFRMHQIREETGVYRHLGVHG